MQSSPIDLHIELSSLKNFINTQIDQRNPYLLYGKELFEVLKRIVIDSEVKPFLTFPKDEGERNYYEKYLRQSQEEFLKLIPDFFEHEGEFYDLDRVQYVYKDFTRAEDFERLFIIKMLELKSNDCSIKEFLSFQQYDSFYGQKKSIDSFLYHLIENDSNCHLLQETCQVIRDWIGSQQLAILKESAVENNSPEPEDTLMNKIDKQETWNNTIESLKGKEIKCKWSLEQIVHYFSFLYKEKSENGEPYLKKEEVEKIFQNGFRIPEKPIKPLFKPNCSKRYPFKNITFGINKFYKESYKIFTDKRAYYLFFSMYIDGYSKFMISPKEYENFSGNTSKALPSRTKIRWDNYLPAGIYTPKKGL